MVPKSTEERIEDTVNYVLEEARMVLPGIQALLGFQFVAVFNQAFSRLSLTDQYLHITAIFFSLNSICLLMTPAAVHRLSQPQNVSQDLAKLAGQLVIAGMVPLLLSFCTDFYIVTNLVSGSLIFSGCMTALIAAEFTCLWFVMPLLRKRAIESKEPPDMLGD